MKKIVISLIILLQIAACGAQVKLNYGELTMGYMLSNDGDAPYYSNISMGASSVFHADGFLFGGLLGFGLIFDNNTVNKPKLDYPCPHSDFAIIGEYKSGFVVHVFPEIGCRLVKKSIFELDIMAGAGMVAGSMGSTIVGRSNTTGWTYDEGSGNGRSILSYDLGARLIISISDFVISGGYSTARGVIVSIGLRPESLALLF